MHDDEMASDETEFWERRHEMSPSADDELPSDEHRLALLVDVADPAVRSAGGQLSARLDRFECFDSSPPEAFHLTVKVFDVSVPSSTVETVRSRPTVRRVDAGVSSVTSECEPFTVRFPRLNLFPDVVYAEVDAGDRLTEMNRAICRKPDVTTLDRDGDNFIPHLTLGYFQNDVDSEELIQFIESNRELDLPTLAVDTLSLVVYDVGGRPPAYDEIKTYRL